MSAGRQPHGAEQLAELIDRPTRGRVLRVHRVVAGEDGDQAALADEREGLDDEVVVQAQAAGVVPRVVEAHVGERDVPDRGIEVPVGQRRLRERLSADRRVGMDRLRDPGGRWVKLDTGQLGACGREPDERASARAGLEHATRLEAEVGERVPHRLRDRGVGVVGVDRRAARRPPRLSVEQLVQLLADAGPLGVGLVEHLGDGPPAAPPREQLALLLVGGPLLSLERAQDVQRLEVRGDASARTARRPRDRRRGYCSSLGSRSACSIASSTSWRIVLAGRSGSGGSVESGKGIRISSASTRSCAA